MQFLKFGIVGASNTLVYLAIFNLLLDFTGEDIAYFIGFFLSVINAYIWSSKFVFAKQEPTDGSDPSADLTKAKQEPEKRKKHTTAKRVVKVYIAYGLTTLLGYALMKFLIGEFEFSPRIASFLILFLTIPLNFVLNKFWVFRS